MFRLQETLPARAADQLERLRQWFRQGRADTPLICVAYSGGVDSTLVAAIAHEQQGERALAVTGVSPALAPHLLQEARTQAGWIGIRHQECRTRELDAPGYSSNPQDRCYACKQELHAHLGEVIAAAEGGLVVDGVNLDDLGDHRPGIKAAREAGVRSPLAELEIDKATIRQLSEALGFPWWDKPAQPCLASRFPYGETITAERLRRVGAAEAWLIQRGFHHIRVRSQGLAARIEIPRDQIASLLALTEQEPLVTELMALGFTSVSVDLEGLVSGKLNRR